MKRTSLQTVTLPPKNELPEWMQKHASRNLPEWIIAARLAKEEEIAARLAQAQRDIPANAFADSPTHWSEYLMAGVFALIVLFFFVCTLACFF